MQSPSISYSFTCQCIHSLDLWDYIFTYTRILRRAKSKRSDIENVFENFALVVPEYRKLEGKLKGDLLFARYHYQDVATFTFGTT